jgi:hypothetical protein
VDPTRSLDVIGLELGEAWLSLRVEERDGERFLVAEREQVFQLMSLFAEVRAWEAWMLDVYPERRGV